MDSLFFRIFLLFYLKILRNLTRYFSTLLEIQNNVISSYYRPVAILFIFIPTDFIVNQQQNQMKGTFWKNKSLPVVFADKM